MLSALWKWLFGGSLFLCIILSIALQIEKRHSHKLANRVTELTAELKRISAVKNEQKIITQEKIKVVTRTIHEAEKRAEKVEQAPLPGQCKTPSEVLQADL
jgi:cob(I)alamin adenosyltransferase